MNKKKSSSAKKIFGTLIFFSVIFFNSENIFAEKNTELEKKLNEIQNEITKLKIEKNLCDDIKKIEKENSEKNFIEKDFDEVFYPENYGISEKGKNARDQFLEEVSIGGFQQIINSFTIQFSGNYCFQRDLKKIDELLYWSIEYGTKLAQYCEIEKMKKIEEKISEIKELKENFESEKIYFQENLYGNSPEKCDEDSITDAKKKIDELKKKIEDLTSGEGSFFDNFSFDEKAIENAKKQAEIDAQIYLTQNLNATLQGLGIKAIIDENNSIWKKIKNTITGEAKNNTEDKVNKDNLKEKINKTEISGDINEFIKETNSKEETSKFTIFSKGIYESRKNFVNLEESVNNQIVANLKGLEIDVIMANGDKKELDEIKEITKKVLSEKQDKETIKNFKEIENEGTGSKELKTLKNFILEFSKFLGKHNEVVGTVESKGILKYGDYGN